MFAPTLCITQINQQWQPTIGRGTENLLGTDPRKRYHEAVEEKRLSLSASEEETEKLHEPRMDPEQHKSEVYSHQEKGRQKLLFLSRNPPLKRQFDCHVRRGKTLSKPTPKSPCARSTSDWDCSKTARKSPLIWALCQIIGDCILELRWGKNAETPSTVNQAWWDSWNSKMHGGHWKIVGHSTLHTEHKEKASWTLENFKCGELCK